MGKKNKIKLTTEQKEWHENLLWYLKKKVKHSVDNAIPKNAVVDGRYAVLSTSGDSKGKFDGIVCSDTEDGAKNIIKWNYCPICLVVDLQTLQEIYEVRKPWSPSLANWREKHDG